MKTLLFMALLASSASAQNSACTNYDYAFTGCPPKDPTTDPPPADCTWETTTDDTCVNAAEQTANTLLDTQYNTCLQLAIQAGQDWDAAMLICVGDPVCERRSWEAFQLTLEGLTEENTEYEATIKAKYDTLIEMYCCSYEPNCPDSHAHAQLPAAMGAVCGAPTYNIFEGPKG